MKGLFLPDFKMPKCCETCIANDDNWKCNVLERTFDYETMDEKRFDDCPLIEAVIEEEVVIPLGTLSKILDGDKTTYDFSEYICEVNGLACSGCSLFCEHRRVRE